MLQKLFISNYALIDSLEIDFTEGFTVITGETGAGKSILLGALGLVLGNRADVSVLFDQEKKCIVEASFQVDLNQINDFFEQNELEKEEHCLLRREISPAGKSRAFINDTPVNLQQIKELGSQLVDIHSQHDSLLLTDNQFQLSLLDDLAGHTLLLAAYSQQFEAFNKTKRRVKQLEEQAAANSRELDFLTFQLEEFEKAQLQENEYEALSIRLNALSHAEEIKSALFQSTELLQSGDANILAMCRDMKLLVNRIRPYLPQAKELAERIESLHIELKDIAQEISQLESESEFDPDELQALQERVDLINHLMFKHHLDDYEKLISLQKALKAQLNEMENVDDELIAAHESLAESKALLSDTADKLHQSRLSAIKPFQQKVSEILAQLGMPFGRFEIEAFRTDQFHSKGNTSVRFMFSANKGVAVAEIAKVASGGELSRLMLAVKSLVSSHRYIPTVIFDEIDTGVSGEVAAKVGRILQTMSEEVQVISITHLPQIASRAAQHLFVYKDEQAERTRSSMRLLNQAERTQEIAKMISNDRVTDEALSAARALLSQEKE